MSAFAGTILNAGNLCRLVKRNYTLCTCTYTHVVFVSIYLACKVGPDIPDN